MILLRKPKEPINASILTFIPILALATIGSYHVVGNHRADMARYAVQTAEPTLAFNTWWSSTAPTGMSYRVDLTGELEEPFVLEWAGDLSPLEKALRNDGWGNLPAWSLHSFGRLWNQNLPLNEIPASPLLSSGKFPEVTLSRISSSNVSRLVLRIWRSDALIAGNSPFRCGEQPLPRRKSKDCGTLPSSRLIRAMVRPRARKKSLMPRKRQQLRAGSPTV